MITVSRSQIETLFRGSGPGSPSKYNVNMDIWADVASYHKAKASADFYGTVDFLDDEVPSHLLTI